MVGLDYVLNSGKIVDLHNKKRSYETQVANYWQEIQQIKDKINKNIDEDIVDLQFKLTNSEKLYTLYSDKVQECHKLISDLQTPHR